MKRYACFFVHRGLQEDVNLWAEDKDELVKIAFNIMNAPRKDIIAFFFWNYDVQKPFTVGNRVDEWHRYHDVGESWNYIED